MSKRKWTDEQLIEAVKTSLSYAEVMRKLGLKAAGSNYDTVKKKIKEQGYGCPRGNSWSRSRLIR